MRDNDKLIADIQSDNNALIKKLDQLDERIAELTNEVEQYKVFIHERGLGSVFKSWQKGGE